MSKKKKAAKAAAAAGTAKAAVSSAKDNEYVQRLVEDDEVRDSLVSAYESGKAAYERLANSKGPAGKALLDDKKLHNELRSAVESLRLASDQLRGKEEKKGVTFGRVIMLAIVGAALGMILSEGLRKTVLDALFGAEEEFEYTSTTSPSPAPATST